MVGTLAQLPAVWVLVGVALALFGALPRLTAGAWAALVGFVLIGQFGQLLALDQWLLDLSPFTHLPRSLGTEPEVTPLVLLTLVGGALVAVGLVGLRRRDIGT